jgi:hypothetical protein
MPCFFGGVSGAASSLTVLTLSGLTVRVEELAAL